MESLAALRVFARVVEHGNFSAAGRQLGMSPSSVSRAVAELENELGARLLQRTTRKLSLTEAGGTYHARAVAILDALDEARLAVAELGDAPSGILRMSAPASLGRLHVAPALPEFHARYPAISVVLTLSDRVTDIVADGVDLALRIGKQRDSSLVARRIGEARRVVCAAPAYLDRVGRPISPCDLAALNCLTFRTHPGENLWRFRCPNGKIAEVRATGSLFSDSGEALLAAARAGLGVVYGPDWLMRPAIVSGALEAILPDFRSVPEASPLYAVFPHARHLPPKVRAAIDFLIEVFGRPSPSEG